MEKETDGVKGADPMSVLSKNMILCYAGSALGKYQAVWVL